MVLEHLVASSKSIRVCGVQAHVHEEPVDRCKSNLHNSYKEKKMKNNRSIQIDQHEHSDGKRSSYQETRQKQLCILGVQDAPIPCLPRLLGLHQRSTRNTTQPNTCQLPSLETSNESCVVLPCIMHSWSHAWLHTRDKNAEGGVGELQEDFRSQHHYTQTSTSLGFEQYSTEGHVNR